MRGTIGYMPADTTLTMTLNLAYLNMVVCSDKIWKWTMRIL